ncbi:hypothetical protein K501DRAFT_306244 [Backusella circina FSU 941]|nr:hypothetical protein K501DRAFT_306244 [Backusella circina FSU 941]
MNDVMTILSISYQRVINAEDAFSFHGPCMCSELVDALHLYIQYKKQKNETYVDHGVGTAISIIVLFQEEILKSISYIKLERYWRSSHQGVPDVKTSSNLQNSGLLFIIVSNILSHVYIYFPISQPLMFYIVLLLVFLVYTNMKG